MNNKANGESLARLSAVNRGIDVVHRSLSDLLLRVAEQQNADDLTPGQLRAVGHTLVSLAGDLTRLGVDMAHWAEELDRAADSRSPAADDGQ